MTPVHLSTHLHVASIIFDSLYINRSIRSRHERRCSFLIFIDGRSVFSLANPYFLLCFMNPSLVTMPRDQEYGDDFEDYNEDFEDDDDDVSPPPLAVAATTAAPSKSATVSAAYVSLLISRRFADRFLMIALPNDCNDIASFLRDIFLVIVYLVMCCDFGLFADL